MTEEHGDMDKAANSGRGIHGIIGFGAAQADSAARQAIVQTAGDLSRVVRQTGGDRPGLYLGDGSSSWDFIGSGRVFENAVGVTEANDGDTMRVGKKYIANASGDVDFQLLLPNSATAANEIKIGEKVVVLTIGGQIPLIRFTAQGTDVFVGQGAVNGTEQDLYLAGNFETVVFTFIGSSLGVPVWSVTGSYNRQLGQKRDVNAATLEALPAYTASGSGQNQILTADVNGLLFVDGIAADISDLGFLIGGEESAAAQYNGLWSVNHPGDGSNPWILRRRSDFSMDGHTAVGATVHAQGGDNNAGRTFIADAFVLPLSAFDWIAGRGAFPYSYDVAVNLTANTNNYLPGTPLKRPWQYAEYVTQGATANVRITGFDQLVTIANKTQLPRVFYNKSSFTITLSHEDVLSTITNRIQTPNGVDLAIPPFGSVTLFYDNSVGRWRVFDDLAASGGGGVSVTDLYDFTDTYLLRTMFDGDATDASGGSRDLSSTGGTAAFITDLVLDFPLGLGNAVGGEECWDNTDDRLEGSTGSPWDALQLTGAMTVMCWVKPDILSSTRYLVTQGDPNDTSNEVNNVLCQLALSGTSLRYYHQYSTGTNESFLSGGTLAVDNWHFVAFTRAANGKDVKLYVDDVEVASTTYTNAPTGGTSGILTVGENTTGAQTYNGKMRGLAILGSEETPAKMLENYMRGVQRFLG